MKIYFTASSRLVAVEPRLYEKMYHHLAGCGKMLNDKVLKWTKKGVANLISAPQKVKIDNYKMSVDCVKDADIVVMEVSGHSVSIGYLIGKALENSKPVIALYKKGHTPVFLKGIVDQKLIFVEYDENNYLSVIDTALKKAKSVIDVRFNFFVSPKILTYLDWIAQKRMVPRSVFLRNLIEKELKKDKEFKI